MKTPVVVFKETEFLENLFIVECLTELNKTTPLVFASDDEEFSQSEVFEANDFEFKGHTIRGNEIYGIMAPLRFLSSVYKGLKVGADAVLAAQGKVVSKFK